MNAELQDLVKRARAENHLAVRNMIRIKQGGYPDAQSVAMPLFVRNNLMAAARHVRDSQQPERIARMPVIQKGDFVRVKASSDFRPGQDGMALVADDGETVGLLFGSDRHNRSASELGITATSLVEEWLLGELDLSSIEH